MNFLKNMMLLILKIRENNKCFESFYYIFIYVEIIKKQKYGYYLLTTSDDKSTDYE